MSSLDEELIKNGFVISPTVGDSMYPLLLTRRDHVVIKSIGEKKLKKYDIPLYKRPDGQYVLHRIIKLDDDFYYTRGDNRCGLEKVPKEWVIGYTEKIYHDKKYIESNDFGYKVYVQIWCTIYPLRWVAMKGKRFLKKLFRKIK